MFPNFSVSRSEPEVLPNKYQNNYKMRKRSRKAFESFAAAYVAVVYSETVSVVDRDSIISYPNKLHRH
jgi:hypothetical protein